MKKIFMMITLAGAFSLEAYAADCPSAEEMEGYVEEFMIIEAQSDAFSKFLQSKGMLGGSFTHLAGSSHYSLQTEPATSKVPGIKSCYYRHNNSRFIISTVKQ